MIVYCCCYYCYRASCARERKAVQSGGARVHARPQGDAPRENRRRRIDTRQLLRDTGDVSDLITWKELKVRGAYDVKVAHACSQANTKQLKFGRSRVHSWGLFAIDTIDADDFIIEVGSTALHSHLSNTRAQYVGETVRKEVAERREKVYEACGLGSSYLFRVDHQWVVDATVKVCGGICALDLGDLCRIRSANRHHQGGLARYINHSCDPNCYTRITEVAGRKHIVINAKRRIEPGEELAYDYKVGRLL